MILNYLKSSFSLSISSSMKEVRKLGLAVQELCKQTPFDEIETYHVELAVVEAANNIVQHAYKYEKDRQLDFNMYLYQDKIILVLTDTGEPVENLTAPAIPIINPQFLSDVPEGKMGLYLIHTVMDTVQILSRDGINIITMTKFFSQQNE